MRASVVRGGVGPVVFVDPAERSIGGNGRVCRSARLQGSRVSVPGRYKHVAIKMFQRLVGVRVQQPTPVPDTYPLPARRIPYRPHRRPGRRTGGSRTPLARRVRRRSAMQPPAPRPVRPACCPQDSNAPASTSCSTPHSRARGCRPAAFSITSVSARATPFAARRGVAPVRTERHRFQPAARSQTADQRCGGLPGHRREAEHTGVPQVRRGGLSREQ